MILNDSTAFDNSENSNIQLLSLFQLRPENIRILKYNKSYFDSKSIYQKEENIYPNNKEVSPNVISLLHVINDNRIWPSFFYSSSD